MNAHAQAMAAQLHGREYGHNVVSTLEAHQAKLGGLVIVYGASDDLMQFEGAITAEVGAPTIRLVDAGGVLPTWQEVIERESERDAADYFKRKASNPHYVEAVWSPPEMPNTSWVIKTAIPHATFDVMEDGDVFCRGIVFSLADVVQAVAA